MRLDEAKNILKNNGYIVEDAKTDDNFRNAIKRQKFDSTKLNIEQDKVNWNLFRKKANKILANFMASIVEDIAEQIADGLGESIDDVWGFYEGGKEAFIKDAISDENEELLNIVGELWNAANKSNQIHIK